MNKITHFSKHAMERIKLRSKLHLHDIAKMLDAGGFIDVGCEPGFNRHHLLFYSRKDNQCFVAIQDRFIGKVITLLPLDYHQNLAWRITDEQCVDAKMLDQKLRQLRKEKHEQEQLQQQRQKQQRKEQLQQAHISKVWLTALYLDENQKQKIKQLGTKAHELYNVQSLTLKTGRDVLKRLCELIYQSGIDPKSVYGLSARQGKKGDFNFVEIQLT